MPFPILAAFALQQGLNMAQQPNNPNTLAFGGVQMPTPNIQRLQDDPNQWALRQGPPPRPVNMNAMAEGAKAGTQKEEPGFWAQFGSEIQRAFADTFAQRVLGGQSQRPQWVPPSRIY